MENNLQTVGVTNCDRASICQKKYNYRVTTTQTSKGPHLRLILTGSLSLSLSLSLSAVSTECL
jgi:hypothetical protein